MLYIIWEGKAYLPNPSQEQALPVTLQLGSGSNFLIPLCTRGPSSQRFCVSLLTKPDLLEERNLAHVGLLQCSEVPTEHVIQQGGGEKRIFAWK